MAKMPFEVGSPKGGIRMKRWLIGLLIFLLASLLAINSFTIGQFRNISHGTTVNQVIDAEVKVHLELSTPSTTTTTTTVAPIQSGYAVNTKGCQIPDLSPFEPSSMKFIDKAEPIVCEQGTHLPLIESNNSAIFVNPEARAHYYNETESIDCCWRSFWRTDNEDNEVTVSKDCHFFQEAAFVNDEFIRVECQRHNESIYRDYFSFAPRKLHVEERCRKYQRDVTTRPRQLSILVVGVDSVSRLNFRRSMPRTLRILEELGALEMLGYHKVADNTYPNLVPVLTGLAQDEFEKLCWKDHKKPFDRCPFLWKNFMAKGYRAIFGEDACSMTTFNYLKPGFRVQPTDYYLRPFCVAAESEIGNTHKLNADLCLGLRLNYATLLHYTRKVAEEFADDPYFGFFWAASLTHDYIEYPQVSDDEYHDFFDYLDKYNLMHNTAVVFMSDHGMRWGSFRQTYQGRLEDSLPMMFLMMPDWWKKQYPDAWEQLQINSKRLTTPFDFHETLWDILDPSRLVEEKESNDIPAHNMSISRGISMFRTIPEERNCDTAGIPEHWCMCHIRYNVSHDDPIVEKLINFLVLEINGMLEKHDECAQLQFQTLIDAKALSTNIDDEDKKKTRPPPWTDYTVTIETSPGNAIFEGSIRHNGSFNLVGSISRLNAYGKQSACVDDFHLRLYCYCL